MDCEVTWRVRSVCCQTWPHMVHGGRKEWLLKVVRWSPHMFCGTHTHMYTHAHICARMLTSIHMCHIYTHTKKEDTSSTHFSIGVSFLYLHLFLLVHNQWRDCFLWWTNSSEEKTPEITLEDTSLPSESMSGNAWHCVDTMVYGLIIPFPFGILMFLILGKARGTGFPHKCCCSLLGWQHVGHAVFSRIFLHHNSCVHQDFWDIWVVAIFFSH